MTFGDIDAMNQRALDSLDKLADIGNYEYTQRLTMLEPEERPYPVSDEQALRDELAAVAQHELQTGLKH